MFNNPFNPLVHPFAAALLRSAAELKTQPSTPPVATRRLRAGQVVIASPIELHPLTVPLLVQHVDEERDVVYLRPVHNVSPLVSLSVRHLTGGEGVSHTVAVVCTDPVPTAPTSSLDGLMTEQRRFMTELGIDAPADGADFLDHPAFKSAVDGVVTEAAEVLDELSVLTKPWKQIDRETTRQNLLEEAVDVFFMLMEVWLLAGQTADDVARIYHAKLARNRQRLAKARGTVTP